MTVTQSIKRALPIFQEHLYSEDVVVLEALLRSGISHPLVHKLLEFMVLAFGRVFLKYSGVHFRDEFVRYVFVEGKMSEKERKMLKDEPMFVESLKVAAKMASRNYSRSFFVGRAVKRRSTRRR